MTWQMTTTRTAPIGPALRDARRAAGLTIDQLAASAELASATVSRIERGRIAKPNRATLRALALALPDDPTTRTGHAGNVTGSKLAVMGDGHGPVYP